MFMPSSESVASSLAFSDSSKSSSNCDLYCSELGNLKTLIGELIALLNGIAFPEISDEGYAQKLRGIAHDFRKACPQVLPCRDIFLIDDIDL